MRPIVSSCAFVRTVTSTKQYTRMLSTAPRVARAKTSANMTSTRRPVAIPSTQNKAFSQRRSFKFKTIEQMKSRYQAGPFTWKAATLFVATGVFLVWYFDYEKERMKRKRMAEMNKGYGKPKVGGAFELKDTNGNIITNEDLKGRYALVYFGFTHCPDICPEELDKMAAMYNIVNRQRPGALTPVFITCDPARDDPKTLKEYLCEFHPDFVGLTGTYEQIRAVCKAYRVYFSTPEHVKPGQDYLVDHSIYFYIMDPEGDFVEVLGRQHSPEEGARVILAHMKDWRGKWRILN